MLNKVFFLLLFISVNTVFGASSYLSYKNTPKKVFQNQIFTVDVNVIITLDKVTNITTEFSNAKSVEVVNKNSKWKSTGDNRYTNRFYYKIKDKKFKLPKISVLYVDSKKLKRKSSALFPFAIKLKPLNPDKFFSQVIAKELEITKYKTTNFDSTHNIVVLRVEAKLSNLEDFFIEGLKKNGINSKELELPITKAYYYAVVDRNLKTFRFSYFNLDKNRFIYKDIPVVLARDEISTQIELNPNKNKFAIYKLIALGIITFIFLLIAFFKKSLFFLIIAIGLGIFTSYNKLPTNSKKLEKGTMVKILPTENSTIFFVTKKSQKVQILNRKGKYIKILLPNNSVGWIEDEDTTKN